MINIFQVSTFGWEAAIRGMRNPMNSWDRSDSNFDLNSGIFVGPNDLKLMKQLASAGNDHAKFLRYICVNCDIDAPLYWWKEYDTYKVGTVTNSCSTMHRIHSKEFTLQDFSHEHLSNEAINSLNLTIKKLNDYRDSFNKTKDKSDWWNIIQLLPSSYNQRRTLLLNYMVLKNIYHSRKNHKLDEWIAFCKWIKSLAYSELICD